MILPGIAALILIPVGIIEAYQMAQLDNPAPHWPGWEAAFIIGVASLLFGVLLMILWNLKSPAFFRGWRRCAGSGRADGDAAGFVSCTVRHEALLHD